MSNIYHLYLDTCRKYSILPSSIAGMTINPHDISKQQHRIMDAMLDIDEALMDLELTRRWFEDPMTKYPFNGVSPISYLYSSGVRGLLEIRLYLTSLRYYMFLISKETL